MKTLKLNLLTAWTKCKVIDLDIILSSSALTTIIGFNAAMIFILIGTYNPDLKYLVLPFLILLTLLFALAIFALISKMIFSWKILISITLITGLLLLSALCIDAILSIFQYGWIICEFCI